MEPNSTPEDLIVRIPADLIKKLEPVAKGRFTYYAKCYCSSEHDETFLHVEIEFDQETFDTLFDARELFTKTKKDLPSLSGLTIWSPAEFGSLNWEGDDYHDALEQLVSTATLVRILEEDAGEHESQEEGEADLDIGFKYGRTEGDDAKVDAWGVAFEAHSKWSGSRVNYFASWHEIENIALDRPPAFVPSETVRLLARGIIVDNAHDRLPILADALEERGIEYGVRSWLLARMRLSPGTDDSDVRRTQSLIASVWFRHLAGQPGSGGKG